MNKSVNPFVALLIVAFFGGLIALNFYFNQRALEVERPTFMAPSADGRFAILVGRELFLIDRASGEESVVNLAKMGFGDTVGNFDFFANNDILMRTGPPSRSFWDSLMVTLRLRNEDFAAAADNALSRCSLATGECRAFSAHLPGFDRAFRVFIDRLDDTVYLADTSRHRLLKLDGSGQLLAFRGGFRFPNQVALVDDQLWVADTNHHRLVAVSPETETFGERQFEIAVGPDGEHTWPSAFARVGDEWWVLAAGANMSDGLVVRYADRGTELDQLEMARNADPLALERMGDTVLVTDYRHFSINRYHLDGARLADFGGPRLTRSLAAKASESQRWKLYAHGCWAVFAMALLLGFVIALRQQRHSRQSQQMSESVASDLPDAPEPLPAKGVWVEATRAAKWLPYVLMALALLTSLMLIPLALEEKPLAGEVVIIVVAMTVSLLLLLKPLRNISKVRLGVFDTHVELIDHEERRHRKPFAEIFWHPRGALVVGSHVLPVGGQARQGFFPKAEIERWVTPRLLPENKVGAWALMKYQWHSPDGMLRHATVMAGVLGVLCLYLERQSLWEWLQVLV